MVGRRASDAAFVPVSLDPDPVIDAYKKDVDRTLIRENLKLSVEDRLRQLMKFQELDRKSTRLNSSHSRASRMPSSA